MRGVYFERTHTQCHHKMVNYYIQCKGKEKQGKEHGRKVEIKRQRDRQGKKIRKKIERKGNKERERGNETEQMSSVRVKRNLLLVYLMVVYV